MLKHLLGRKKSDVLADKLPRKTELAILCEMGGLQSRVYKRATESLDYRIARLCEKHSKENNSQRLQAFRENPGTIWRQQQPRFHKKDEQGVYGTCKVKSCPKCIIFPLMMILQKIAVSVLVVVVVVGENVVGGRESFITCFMLYLLFAHPQ